MKSVEQAAADAMAWAAQHGVRSAPGTLLGLPVVEMPDHERPIPPGAIYFAAPRYRMNIDAAVRRHIESDRRRYNRARRKAVRAILAGLAHR